MKFMHGAGHQIGTDQNVNRQAVGGRQQFAIARHDAAREIAGAIEDAGAAGSSVQKPAPNPNPTTAMNVQDYP
jgi:hypothetical protein